MSTVETPLPERHSKPVVPRPLVCKLGFHKLVPFEAARARMSPMMRRFIVRKIEVCTRCGRVTTARFTNGMAGGGSFTSGYVDPKELTPCDTSKANTSTT